MLDIISKITAWDILIKDHLKILQSHEILDTKD